MSLTLFELEQLALRDYGRSGVTQMLLALLQRDPVAEFERWLRLQDVDVASVYEQLHAQHQAGPPSPREKLEDSSLLTKAKLGHRKAATGRDLLRELCKSRQHRVTEALARAGVDPDQLLECLSRTEDRDHPSGEETPGKGRFLERYGRDLTAEAQAGKLTHLYERGELLDAVVRGMLRRQKGSVMITGPAGAGKSALVESFAVRLASGEVPGPLTGTGLILVDMGVLVAGTRYRGDFEERVEGMLKEIARGGYRDYQRIVLAIDEAHLLLGAGSAEKTDTTAANLLKPALARGDLRVIAATTDVEYQHLEKGDAALVRRFERVALPVPIGGELKRMVALQANALEVHHAVEIPESLVDAAIELTDRHVPARTQPDKAVTLLDTAAAEASMARRTELAREDLVKLIAQQTGRPISALEGDERTRLIELRERLNQRVVGQSVAAEKVAATLGMRRMDLSPRHPHLGSFLFAGSTGCGKTEMAKAIHDNLFGRPDLMLHVDLGEYKLKESLHKLIGVPKGYVGSDRPGVLSEFLQRTATGTLLFDEAEKAHPDVLHALLALCDEGRLRTGDAQLLDARHCVIILTTNAVRAQDLERKQIGFGAGHSRGSAEQLLRDSFPPELLARMDAVVVFDQLGDDAMRSVVGLRLDEALQHLGERDVRLEFDRDRLVEHLLGRLATRSGSGARGIQRILEEVLLQPVARAVLVAHGSGPDHFVLDDAFYSRGVVRHDSSPATGENLSCL